MAEGWEATQDIRDHNSIVVPLRGGGLLAGIAVVVKEINLKVRVIGVEPEAIPRYSARHSEIRTLGKPVEVLMKGTIIDGLMITKNRENIYPIIEKYVDEVVAVNDEFIYKTLPEVIFIPAGTPRL